MAKAEEILDAAKVIESFVDGTCGLYEWDDFLNGSKRDAELQKIREECERVEIDYPARNDHEWCNDEGSRALKQIASRLRLKISDDETLGVASPEQQESKPNKSAHPTAGKVSS